MTPLPSDGFSQALCSDLAALRYENIPSEVLQTCKLFLLDSLGTLAAGATAPGINTLIRRLTNWETAGNATILFDGRQVSPPTAALANAAAAHALDFDDQHDSARVHSYCCIVPSLIAATEAQNLGGKDFLTALVVGVEFHARLGLACFNSLRRGWMPTVACGTLASAVSVGHALKLTALQLNNALGIAYHQASGNGQARQDHSLTKRLGPGFAARSGVLAAYLALDGMTGPHRALEGEAGLFRLFESGEADANQLTNELGSNWRLLDFSMKPYPSCRCNHTVIDLGIALHREGLKADDVAEAEIYLGEVNYHTVKGAFEPGSHSQAHAQFNAAYNFARALVDGRVELSSFVPEAVADPSVGRLAQTFQTKIAADFPERSVEPARVRVVLKDGSVIERSKMTMTGSPDEPLSTEQIILKFRSCLLFGLNAGDEESTRLAGCTLDLENQSVGALVQAFPSKIRPR